MSGSNAGVPVSHPAAEPIVRGPFRIWRGHPSPIPWFGKFEAAPEYSYYLRDRQSNRRFGPVCHRCVVELMYRYSGFCEVDWNKIESPGAVCDWCDVLMSSAPVDNAAQSRECS